MPKTVSWLSKCGCVCPLKIPVRHISRKTALALVLFFLFSFFFSATAFANSFLIPNVKPADPIIAAKIPATQFVTRSSNPAMDGNTPSSKKDAWIRSTQKKTRTLYKVRGAGRILEEFPDKNFSAENGISMGDSSKTKIVIKVISNDKNSLIKSCCINESLGSNV